MDYYKYLKYKEKYNVLKQIQNGDGKKIPSQPDNTSRPLEDSTYYSSSLVPTVIVQKPPRKPSGMSFDFKEYIDKNATAANARAYDMLTKHYNENIKYNGAETTTLYVKYLLSGLPPKAMLIAEFGEGYLDILHVLLREIIKD